MNTFPKQIGMIVPGLDNSFFSSLAYYVEREMSKRDIATLTASSANDAEKERKYLRKMVELGLDGIICISGLSELPEDLLPARFPLVWIDRVPVSKRVVPWVANDDVDAMEKATEHLLKKGCRHILLLPGYTAERQENPRVVGYRRALEKYDIPFDAAYVLDRAGKRPSEVETGELVQQTVGAGVLVDGIIASSDRAAFGAARALQHIGYFVPEDVRLISFDNSPYSTMSSPSITALDRKSGEMAQKACEVLLRVMKGDNNGETEHFIHVNLVERDSTR